MEIKIYVANLGKYNEGELVGEWFTLPVDVEEIYTTIGVGRYDENGDYKHGVIETDENGNSYHYEEFAIHDFEAPAGIKISEYYSIKKLNEIAEQIENIDEEEAKVILALIDNGIISEFEEGKEALENGRFYYECNDMSDVAYAWHEETGTDMDAHLIMYVDWERVGRDMSINGTFIELDNNTWFEYFS